MAKVKISSSMKEIFGDQAEFEGTWKNLEEFLNSLPSSISSRLMNSNKNLNPFIKVRINEKIVRVKEPAHLNLSPNDNVTFFMVASGG